MPAGEGRVTIFIVICAAFLFLEIAMPAKTDRGELMFRGDR